MKPNENIAAGAVPALTSGGLTAGLQFAASGLAAGACIGIAAMSYLRTGALAGCVLFAFGLMAVVFFDLKLFTGKSQYAWGRRNPADPASLDYGRLAAILLLNIIGCAAMTLLNSGADPAIEPGAIVDRRFADGALLSGIKAIPCGFIMTLAVRSAKGGIWWPLLFGVPTFIVCGFPHCIADVFYYASDPVYFVEAPAQALTLYFSTVIGNYFGCNIYRAFPAQISLKQ